MNIIKKYNSWVYNLSKKKYIILLIITSLLETFCFAVLPSIIDNNFENVFIKIGIILPLFLVVNFCVNLRMYNKHNE